MSSLQSPMCFFKFEFGKRKRKTQKKHWQGNGYTYIEMSRLQRPVFFHFFFQTRNKKSKHKNN